VSPLPNPFSIDETSVFEERRISEFLGEGLQVGRPYSKESGRR
jgi:hypothetical protein